MDKLLITDICFIISNTSPCHKISSFKIKYDNDDETVG